MMLLIKADQVANYIRRPLPPTPYLLEEPRAATAALEAAIRACPKKDFSAKASRPTYNQRYDLGEAIDSPYLTYREAVWVELWRYEFDANTATQVLTQLQLIIAHRQASGTAPVYHKGKCFFPERPTPPQP
ncbi:hypothetical protein [Hymenobacter sp. IS2118]|uniref:hypothetical protein n=1 Tax=Hymenobacter sp. IS2118 TaxID=1505605 RepID=UPI00054D1CC9|nr:hypothetical protein [Hymenobacter sp. IS2118]